MILNRRQFVAGSIAAALTGGGSRAPRKTGVNLVPARPSGAPNYWSTWSVQNYMYGQGMAKVDVAQLEGSSGSRLAQDALNEKVILGGHGWAKQFYPKVRQDLFLLLDQGWEKGGAATFELDETKFPSFGSDPTRSLLDLNHAIQNEGWRGLALWCHNPPAGHAGRRLQERSQSAGVQYWKIDVGDPEFLLMQMRNEAHIPLTLEYAHGEPPTNGDWHHDGRWGAQSGDSGRVQILRNTDVYRTYGVTSILSLPTTLDRVAEMLRASSGHPEITGLLNVEDEVYLAAVVGCSMGVMRHPLTGLRPGDDVDLFLNGPRQPKKRMDEVVRALRWQRIAPPFSAGHGSVAIDDEILTDSWVFERGQTWWTTDLIGATVRQGAPARLARGIDLPAVNSTSESKPFVCAARFPNGAVAVGAGQRTVPGHGWYVPPCEVALSVGSAPGPFGIFGSFEKLTLVFDKPVNSRRIFAQDLAGEESVDIRRAVEIHQNSLSIPGEVISRVGLQDAAPGDLSSPGLVVSLR
jgi:hypothetical protein